MGNTILYLDCDGVIFDTIETAYSMMRERFLDISNPQEVNRFFINSNWYELIDRAGIIDNAIGKIKKIIEYNHYKEVIILTKLSGNIKEEKIKRVIFDGYFPGIKVITLKINEHKDEIVNPKGHILVDDSLSNIIRWRKKGGIGILFSKKNTNDELAINDLNDIVLVKK